MNETIDTVKKMQKLHPDTIKSALRVGVTLIVLLLC